MSAKLIYLTALRRRKRLGWIVDSRNVGGEKVFKIRKIYRTMWVNPKDVVEILK